MEIKYTAHLNLRLKVRQIPYELPREILEAAREFYHDTLTGHYVAVHPIRYKGKLREMAIVYDKRNYFVEIVTIHPIQAFQKNKRIESGRWIPYDEKKY